MFALGLAQAQSTALRPFDRVRVTSTGSLALSVDRTLGADGAVKLPGLPIVFLAGRTASEAVLEIKRVGGAKLGSVGLSLLPYKDAPIAFRGAVKHSGELRLGTPKTLRQVIEIAQPLEGADLSAIQVNAVTGEQIVADGEGEGQDLPLRPGDEIVFAFRTVADEILVLGAVKEPGSKPYRKSETLGQAVERAGGLTGHAVQNAIRVLRDGQPVEGAEWTDQGKATILQRGDVVQVPTAENARYVSVVGYVKNPGLVPFKAGMTLLEAIAAAGGTTVGAGLNAVEVRKVFRGQGGPKKYDLSMLKPGSPNDPKLAAADIVFVPAFVFKDAEEKKKKFNPVIPPRRAR